jgi:HEAT repeat protein
MLDRLIHALVNTENEAADLVLLQAVRMGNPSEQNVALDALIERNTSYGLRGVVGGFDSYPRPLQERILGQIKQFHHVLGECGRSSEAALRLAAIELIALGRQGKLAYVLSENLHESDDTYSKAACEAIVALARWVAMETRRLQRRQDAQPWGHGDAGTEAQGEKGRTRERETGTEQDLAASEFQDGAADDWQIYEELIAQRPEIEAAVARAINLHRGKHAQDLLRAALLLADWAGSKTLAILQTARHGGQSAMIRRLQQPPASEHVEAYLLAGARGNLRAHFASVFSRIDEAPVLDAMLRRTYWLKDNQLQTSMHQVSRGVWWEPAELARDLERRDCVEASLIGQWLAVSGIHDIEQDERLAVLLDHANKAAVAAPQASLSARLRLLRTGMQRKRGASVRLIRTLLSDPDERIVRMAAREIVRRRPADFENMLLKLMAGAPASVRAVVGRAIGQAGFEQYWQRFDKLDKATRQQAGKAMLKLLPDAQQRLQRRAISGPPEQRVKAMQIAQELGIAQALQQVLSQLCADPSARVRSKATSVLGQIPGASTGPLIDRLVNDADPRVRANAIEILESRPDQKVVELLAERALAANGRERANAIKALCRMKVSTASRQLLAMLRDDRPEHRISALWVLRQIGWWQLVNEVGQLAKADQNIRVRRYALGVLKAVAELVREQKGIAG